MAQGRVPSPISLLYIATKVHTNGRWADEDTFKNRPT